MVQHNEFAGLAAGLSADRVWARRMTRIIAVRRIAALAARGLGSVAAVTGTWVL